MEPLKTLMGPRNSAEIFNRKFQKFIRLALLNRRSFFTNFWLNLLGHESIRCNGFKLKLSINIGSIC